MINVYDSKETDFTKNGLVVLSECINCTIAEEINGQYELTLEYPLLDPITRFGTLTTGRIVGTNNVGEEGLNGILPKWQYLLENNIIKADGQLFRIYHKVKSLDSVKVNARHIFYDLLDNFLEDVRPTNLNGAGALDWVLTHTQYSHPFVSMSDVSTVNTKYFVRKNPVEAIMGSDGIIKTWGGELVRDNFNIKLLGARGLDRGVLVAYGKNIQGIEETLDIDGICTRLMPIGKDGLLLPEKYLDSPYINNFTYPKVKVVEFNDITTIEELRAAGQDYFISSKCDIPQFNYKVDFLEFSKTEEYKNYAILETVYMGDTVTIKHSKLNINLKAKVIKITKNVLTNRIEKVELGSFKANLATSISSSIQNVKDEIVSTKSFLQSAIDSATAQINSALGGYVVKRNGELLIMDSEDINAATKVWRWNINGLGYSGTGYNGPYRTAITADGHFVADFIDTGILTAALIKAGVLSSLDGSISMNMEDGEFTLGGGDNVTTITKDYVKVTHSDGSYSILDASGLKHYNAGTKTNYHHLAFTDEAYSSTGSGDLVIELPAEFRGKDFVVTAALSSIGDGVENSAVSRAWVTAPKSLYDKPNGRFTVRIDCLNVNTSSGVTERGGCFFTYYAIA